MSEQKRGIAQISWRTENENPTVKFCYGGIKGQLTGSKEDVTACFELLMMLESRARDAEESVREVKQALNEILQ